MNKPEVIELVKEAMDYAEQMPMGGIGEHGPTLEEMTAEHEKGRPHSDDACFDNAQMIWLKLKQALTILESANNTTAPAQGLDAVPLPKL